MVHSCYVSAAINLCSAHVLITSPPFSLFQMAIKVIDTKKIKEDYVRANLHREARIMAHLRHPNIIRLYETMKVCGFLLFILCFLAMIVHRMGLQSPPNLHEVLFYNWADDLFNDSVEFPRLCAEIFTIYFSFILFF